VGPHPIDNHDPGVERDCRIQPILVALDVEDGAASDETYGWVPRPHVLRRLPIRLLGFRHPSSHLRPNLRVSLDEVGKGLPPQNFHAGFRTLWQFPFRALSISSHIGNSKASRRICQVLGAGRIRTRIHLPPFRVYQKLRLAVEAQMLMPPRSASR